MSYEVAHIWQARVALTPAVDVFLATHKDGSTGLVALEDICGKRLVIPLWSGSHRKAAKALAEMPD